MDNIWCKKLSNDLGQSTVEYILLFAVVTSIAITIFKSGKFDEIFGANGTISNTYRNQLEQAYRHGYIDPNSNSDPDYNSGTHRSYNGRFFSASDPYP